MKVIIKSLKMTLSMSILLCIGYVCLVWGVSRSIGAICHNNVSANISKSIESKSCFWGRPDSLPEKNMSIDERINNFLKAHPYLTEDEIPSEMVTSSGSGMDPDISPEGAYVQIRRVAQARGMNQEILREIVKREVKHPFLGPAHINVRSLNDKLDQESMKLIR